MAISDSEVEKGELENREHRGENGSTDTLGANAPAKDAVPNDQISKTLPEDDPVSQITKSLKSSGQFMSSSEAALSSTSTSVTAERKEFLLAQARADRLEWIRKVPLPYKCERKSNNGSSKTTTYIDAWNRDPRLAELKNTFVFQQSQSAVQVVAHLYGLSNDSESAETLNESIASVSTRVGAILDQINETEGDDNSKLAVPTAEQIRHSALAEDEREEAAIRSYHTVVSKLADPAAAVLVQGMRGFCRKIRNETIDTLPAKLQGYLRMQCESLPEYGPWKETEISQDTRRSLESFIYGQCQEYIDELYWTDTAKEDERQWQERLTALGFVSPKHLEIRGLDNEQEDYTETFKKSIEALLSVDKFFSPFEKLQRILAIYHNVNAALTVALNRSNSSGAKKPPSADDVLPSIIMTVLLARSARLLLNLQIIEDLAPPEYLRGEAGYAYTNLYGAVQFLRDIDLDADKPASLKISADDFRKSLQECREAAEERHTQRKGSVTRDVVEAQTLPMSLEDTAIPVADIREARLRGENVDLAWAKGRLSEWNEIKTSAEAKVTETIEESDGLPQGFTRSYTFLSSRPEDIKMSDLPKLLSEYKMLVHTTESLIGEKFAKAAAEKKAKFAAKRKEVYEAAKKVDPTLVPPMKSRSKRN